MRRRHHRRDGQDSQQNPHRPDPPAAQPPRRRDVAADEQQEQQRHQHRVVRGVSQRGESAGRAHRHRRLQDRRDEIVHELGQQEARVGQAVPATHVDRRQRVVGRAQPPDHECRAEQRHGREDLPPPPQAPPSAPDNFYRRQHDGQDDGRLAREERRSPQQHQQRQASRPEPPPRGPAAGLIVPGHVEVKPRRTHIHEHSRQHEHGREHRVLRRQPAHREHRVPVDRERQPAEQGPARPPRQPQAEQHHHPAGRHVQQQADDVLGDDARAAAAARRPRRLLEQHRRRSGVVPLEGRPAGLPPPHFEVVVRPDRRRVDQVPPAPAHAGHVVMVQVVVQPERVAQRPAVDGQYRRRQQHRGQQPEPPGQSAGVVGGGIVRHGLPCRLRTPCRRRPGR
ncbi:MAG: hypothetical protein BIFFINMI_03832 [Phycisphaerae bacterium]|nr:hypothetical protein [Phycisphaerae bacterium]